MEFIIKMSEKISSMHSEVSFYFTEFGAALRTVLPVLFKYCYKYWNSRSSEDLAVPAPLVITGRVNLATNQVISHI
jgi:hypothetical protein